MKNPSGQALPIVERHIAKPSAMVNRTPSMTIGVRSNCVAAGVMATCRGVTGHFLSETSQGLRGSIACGYVLEKLQSQR